MAAVDTTARAFLRSTRDPKSLKKDIVAALKKRRLKVAGFTKSKLRKPAAIYEIDVKGLG